MNILKRMGHEAIIAWNGEEAVNTFFQANPPIDLVLMDLFMPIMYDSFSSSISSYYKYNILIY